MTAVTLIDNYDSFTYNLWHYLGELGATVTVHRKPDAIVGSPGPCTPTDAGICLDLIRQASATVPLFGVCLGHQAIGQVFGGDVIRAPLPMHGKMSEIHHEGRSVFRGLNHPFQATRYHSLIVDRATLPDALEVTAHTDDGLIMGLAHRTLPVHGVQFHPESIASENGHALMRNFLELATAFNESRKG